MFRSLGVAFAGLLMCASVALAADKTYQVASDATWPPNEFLNAEKQVIGYSIDYIQAVAKEAGIKVQVKNTAWDGIFAALGSHQADIIVSSVTITDKRKKAMAFTEPYCELSQAIVVTVDSPVKSIQDLEGKKVGGQIGTTGLVETMPKSKVKSIIKTYDEVGLALEDLARGNLDAVICDEPVAKFYANKKEEYAGKLKVAFATKEKEVYGFALRKDDKELLDKLNAGIRIVKEKGIEKQLVEKWMGK